MYIYTRTEYFVLHCFLLISERACPFSGNQYLSCPSRQELLIWAEVVLLLRTNINEVPGTVRLGYQEAWPRYLGDGSSEGKEC